MSTTTKIAAVALAAVTLGTTVLAGSGEAQARGWGWGGVGLGVAAGAVIGAGLATRSYYEPNYVYVDAPRCRWVRQFDANGYYAGKTKVCNY
jgi:hypothetical protein